MALTRYYSHFKHRTTSFYNPCTGGLWSELTKLHKLEIGTSLENMLAQCDTQVLYMMPDSNGQYPSAEDFYSMGNTSKVVYRKDPKHGFIGARVGLNKSSALTVVNIYPLTRWFTISKDTMLSDMIKAYMHIQKMLEAKFQPRNKEEQFNIEMLSTPATTGNMLLMYALPFNVSYEPLEEEIATILLANSTQGHFETFYHGDKMIDDLHYYDGVWMYASCLRHVPTGQVTHDNVSEIALTEPSKTGTQGYIQGFYKALVTIPHDWQHIGLLPEKTSGTPSYPRKGTFETFATSTEIALAIKHGWQIEVLERILWPNTDKEKEPLKQWGMHLIDLRMSETEKLQEPVRSIVKSGFRNLLLQTVGSWFTYVRGYDFYTDDPTTIPVGCDPLKEGDLWKYTLAKELTAYQKLFCQPHWPMWVWGLTRRKLAENALKVPYDQLIALRADGIWCNCAIDYGQNTGKPGFFAEKHLSNTSGFKWPKSTAQFLKLRDSALGRQ